MNVEFAWSLAQKWSCLIVAMQCASNATAIGNHKRQKYLLYQHPCYGVELPLLPCIEFSSELQEHTIRILPVLSW